MLERTPSVEIGVVGQICIRNVPPPYKPPPPPPPVTQPPVPRPPDGGTADFDVQSVSGYSSTTTIVRVAGDQCVMITEYHMLQNTSQWILDQLGPVPEREVVPLAECPEGI